MKYPTLQDEIEKILREGGVDNPEQTAKAVAALMEKEGECGFAECAKNERKSPAESEADARLGCSKIIPPTEASKKEYCCSGEPICLRGRREGCNGAHCRCVQKDCPNMHYSDCKEHYKHTESSPLTCPECQFERPSYPNEKSPHQKSCSRYGDDRIIDFSKMVASRTCNCALQRHTEKCEWTCSDPKNHIHAKDCSLRHAAPNPPTSEWAEEFDKAFPWADTTESKFTQRAIKEFIARLITSERKEVYQNGLKTVQEGRTEATSKIISLIEGMLKKQEPTHGECCTCQRCGYPNDYECECARNKILTDLKTKIEKDL